jgi:hypothetical protein
MACAPVAYVANGLRRFECWAWFFVAGSLVMPLPGVAWILFGEPSPATTVTTSAAFMMLAGALHYLWVRRWDFWNDARLERRRKAPRAVPPEWRAARLARIGAGPLRSRRAIPPQPGALWMRRPSAVRR